MSQPLDSDTPDYIVGIDLGTTHCVVSYAHLQSEEPEIHVLPIPQWVGLNAWQEVPHLPAFLYQFHPDELSEAQWMLPWSGTTGSSAANPIADNVIIGRWARALGEKTPNRLIASAKSWLGQDQGLPLDALSDVKQLTPVESIQCLLGYLMQVWNVKWPEAPLSEQRLIMTIPASFDPLARQLTAQAAQQLQLTDVVLLEEPQAALYHWLYQHTHWRDQLMVQDVLLVVDVGGGTCDFSLIMVEEQQGAVALERVAVGEHILLGGDNMDLALAYVLKQSFAEQGKKIKNRQMTSLVQLARSAKEQLFAEPDLEHVPIALADRGAALIGNTLRTQLTRDQLNQVLLEGFFPLVDHQERPAQMQGQALSRQGLAYAEDPAITRQLAAFLQGKPFPTKVLLNGGVFKAAGFRQRLHQQLKQWAAEQSCREPEYLQGYDLEAAVSIGATYYGHAQCFDGVRIRGGIAQSYYIGIESARPAVPGMPPSLQALCVAPFGLEEGSTAVVVPQVFNLSLGKAARFQFFGSGQRADDQIGDLLDEEDTEELVPLPDIQVDLTSGKSELDTIDRVPVQLASRVSEVGTLEIEAIECRSVESPSNTSGASNANRWQVSLDVRSPLAEGQTETESAV